MMIMKNFILPVLDIPDSQSLFGVETHPRYTVVYTAL